METEVKEGLSNLPNTIPLAVNHFSSRVWDARRTSLLLLQVYQTETTFVQVQLLICSQQGSLVESSEFSEVGRAGKLGQNRKMCIYIYLSYGTPLTVSHHYAAYKL